MLIKSSRLSVHKLSEPPVSGPVGTVEAHGHVRVTLRFVSTGVVVRIVAALGPFTIARTVRLVLFLPVTTSIQPGRGLGSNAADFHHCGGIRLRVLSVAPCLGGRAVSAIVAAISALPLALWSRRPGPVWKPWRRELPRLRLRRERYQLAPQRSIDRSR